MANKLNTKAFILSTLKDKIIAVQKNVQKEIIFKAKQGCKTCGGRK